MTRTLRTVIAAVLIAISSSVIAALMFRSRPTRLIRVVRAFNKRVLNPLMLRFAGKRGFYAAALHHVGRTSGRRYVTPVRAEPIHDGVLIPLPYGTKVDWLQNVLAAGSADLVAHGATMAVHHPAVIPAGEARRHLASRLWRRYQNFGVHEYLRLCSTDERMVIRS